MARVHRERGRRIDRNRHAIRHAQHHCRIDPHVDHSAHVDAGILRHAVHRQMADVEPAEALDLEGAVAVNVGEAAARDRGDGCGMGHGVARHPRRPALTPPAACAEKPVKEPRASPTNSAAWPFSMPTTARFVTSAESPCATASPATESFRDATTRMSAPLTLTAPFESARIPAMTAEFTLIPVNVATWA